MNQALNPETINFFDDFEVVLNIELEAALDSVQAGKIEAEAMEIVMQTMDTAWANGDRALLQIIAMNIAASACNHDHLGPFSEALSAAFPDSSLQHHEPNGHKPSHEQESDKKKKKAKNAFGWFWNAWFAHRS